MVTSTLDKALTQDEAVKMANEVERLEAVLKSMKEKLKAYVDQHGALETNEKVWDYSISVSWEFNPELIKEMAQDIAIDGKNPWQFLTIPTGNVKSLGWSEGVLMSYGKKKETRKFNSKKK